MGDKTAIKPTWDPYKLMNVTRNELEVVAQRKKMKEELKVKWQRISTNPHVSASGGGHFLDPAVQRWLTARTVARNTNFKLNTRTVLPWVLLAAGPIIVFSRSMIASRAELDARCRRGEIPSSKRMFRLRTW